jgi:hypothetical protein
MAPTVAHTRTGARLGRDLSVAAETIWRMRRRTRQRVRAGTPGVKVIVVIVLALLLAPVAYHLLSYVLPLPLLGGSEQYCSKHGLSCDLTIHILGDVVVAVVVYAAFLRRQVRTATIWRSRAKTEPERVFTWLGPVSGGLTENAATSATTGGRVAALLRKAKSPRSSPIVESILGRDELVREIADDLDNGSEPQVIVSDSAAGKTMVLVKLADFLARRGQVPVAISLQGQEGEPDFEALARKAFESASPTSDRDDLKKQWSELRHREQITVLADDLEKAKARPHQIMHALEQATRQKLRLVAASRPYGVPVDFKRGRIELEPLHNREVRRDLLRLMQHAPADAVISDASAQQIVADIVEDAEISLTPYYLSLARVLARLGKLTAPTGTADARLWLLRSYRAALAAGSVRPDAGPSPARRAEVLRSLEAIAFVRLLGKRQESAIADELSSPDYPDMDVQSVLGDVRRLGVVETRYDGRVHFAHPTTLAYFASCYLVDPGSKRSAWGLLMDQDWGPFRALTLIFATTAAGDGELRQSVCKRLLERAAERDPASQNGSHTGSSWLATAAEIANCGKSVDKATAAAVLHRVQGELDRTRQFGRAQAGMLKALGRLCQSFQLPEAYEALWKYATVGGDYSFRRQATKALAQGKYSIEALSPTIDDVMASATRYAKSLTRPAVDDHDEPFDSLRAVAWILPSLRSVADPGRQKAKLDDYQADLLRFANALTVQRGLEAPIAQGLKFDAVRDSSLPPDPFAIAMLRDGQERARFWFSRVLLLQALARRCEQDDTGEARSLIRDATSDEHEFVRRTAKLCIRGLESDRPDRFLFEDLTEVAGRAPYDLASATSQLIGDIVLALNLNEYGDAQSRSAFGDAPDLPACLTATRDRRPILVLEQERPACPFEKYQQDGCLCPYTSDPPKNGNRRELSRAFCRHQRLNARRLPWNKRVSARELKRFWAEMENLARY